MIGTYRYLPLVWSVFSSLFIYLLCRCLVASIPVPEGFFKSTRLDSLVIVVGNLTREELVKHQWLNALPKNCRVREKSGSSESWI